MTMWRSACALAAAATVGACASSGSTCDGWRAIRIKPASAVYLVTNDRTAGEDIASHNEFGRVKCGWKTGGAF